MAFYASKFANKIKVNKLLLLFFLFWVLGLLLGAYAAASSHNTYTDLITEAARKGIASYLSLLFIVFSPWALSILLYRTPSKLPFMLIVLFKAFTFSFSTYAILTTFSSAGWLVRYLIMFSANVSVVAFLWFWIRRLSSSVTNKLLTLTAFVVFIAVSVDFWIISPYLISLF